jgi:hypothetical protein
MRKKYLVYMAPLLVLLLSASLATAAEVIQGKCIVVDEQRGTITVEEHDTNFDAEHPYGTPTGNLVQINVTKAKIGIPPEPGDILRFAYNVVGSDKMALRVMNVTKQDLRKK